MDENMQQGIYQLVRYKSHCSIYRGFNVYKLPRNKIRTVTRYRVTMGDDSYGMFDALAQALGYIDYLCGAKK